MSKKKIKLSEIDQNEVAKYIFLGLTNTQIANKMHCSLSTVSYRSSALFKRYGVKTRERFVLKVLSEVLETNKTRIVEAKVEIEKLKEKTQALKDVIYGIISATNKEKYAFWLKEAKKHI